MIAADRKIPRGWQVEIDAGTPKGLRFLAALEKPPGLSFISNGTVPARVLTVFHRELVGTAMRGKIEGLLKIKSGKGCKCKILADDMDRWGIAGCELRRSSIVEKLRANREILTVSLAKSAFRFAMAMGVQ